MKRIVTDTTWVDLFIIELRLRGVPGAVIGDMIASVREHLADSEQSAEEAFGPVREYVASLDLPTRSLRQELLKAVLVPILGVFALIIFALASAAWFAGDPVLLSIPQALLLATPVLLAALFTIPSFLRTAFRLPWIPVTVVLTAGASSALAAFIAPSTEDAAWLALSPLPLLIATVTTLVILAVSGTLVTLRDKDGDEIIEPLEPPHTSGRRRRNKTLLLITDWLFPILAALIFVMTLGLSVLRS